MTWAYLLVPIRAQPICSTYRPWTGPGDTIYTTLTIKIRSGAGLAGLDWTGLDWSGRRWQAATYSIIFIVLHTLNKFASINVVCALPLHTDKPRSRPASWRWQAHIVDANQSVKWSDGPETLARKYALMDFLLPHNCAKFHYINGGKPCPKKAAGKTFMRASLPSVRRIAVLKLKLK